MFLGDRHPISLYIVITVHGVFCFIARFMWRGERERERGGRERGRERLISLFNLMQ
jgi:hypothetical protein